MAKSVARLFEQFEPENYQLSLHPDRNTMTFKGTVTITGKKVGRPSKRLTFHQKGLKIVAATVVKHDKKGEVALNVARINKQDTANEVRVHFDEMVYPGKYTISLDFNGIITKPMHGIYPCYFKHQGEQKMLIATQFESHHAREAFPCIDEPEAKATIDLTLTTPAGETVIANTPVHNQETVEQQIVTTFETTPRMSTYLLAFAYGDLEYAEAKTTSGVVVRTYATPGNLSLMGFGLQTAVRALEFYDDYFNVPYPLPKLDMIALPDFSSAAMENWGLVTYRETVMLVDDKTSSIETKQLVAMVIAHELSHQWFGNLVTMKWWDDLWLNESFANMMEYRCVDALFPEWHIWEQFVSIEQASAKRRDSLLDVQSIKTTVNHPDEISTLFDPSIVYAKGGSVLYMLLNYIGEEAFRAGLSNYFATHRYGNTEAKDLWEALSITAKQDISGFMQDWLTRPGFPLISLDWQPGTATAKLTQRRFLSDASIVDSKPWQVPMAANVELDQPLLTTPLATIKIALKDTQSTLLLNHNGRAYMLPHYESREHLVQIVQALKNNQIDTVDRLLLLDNYLMLQRGGVASLTDLLELLPAYQTETSENVWGSIAAAVGEARRLVEGDEASETKLDGLVGHLAADIAVGLGWEDADDDSAQTLHLRGLTHSIAAGAKVPIIIDEGLTCYRSFSKPADLPPSTRTVIYFIGVRHGDQADYQKLLDLYHSTSNADELDEIAGALTAVKQPAQYNELLDLLTSDAVRRQDLMHWFIWLLRNRYSREATWAWLTSHWDWILEQFDSDKSYGGFARYPGSIFSTVAELAKYQAFFADKKQIVALTRDIKLGEEEISNRIAWRDRNEAATKAWLAKL